MTNRIEDHLDLLGYEATDRVTRFRGVITSVCFDLYGCVMAALTPIVDRDGKLPDQGWCDVKRLEVHDRAMEPPDFTVPKAGGAAKPLPHRN